MPRLRLVSVCIAIALTSLPTPARPQAAPAPRTDPASVPGKWRPTERPEHGFDGVAQAQDRARLQAQFEKVLAVFRDARALGPPVGVDIRPSLSSITRYAPFLVREGRPFPAMMWLSLIPYTRTCPDCAPLPGSRWTGAFVVAANEPQMLWDSQQEWKVGDERFIREPTIVGSVGGFPIYKGGYAVLTHRPEPLFVPVTQERYLAAEIRQKSEAIAAFRKKTVDSQREREVNYRRWLAERPARARQWDLVAASLPRDSAAAFLARMARSEREVEESFRQATLFVADTTHMAKWLTDLRALEAFAARMTPAQRAAPARICGLRPVPQTFLCEPDDPAGLRLVVVNPAFFDPALPRTDFQLLVVVRDFHGSRDPATTRTRNEGWESLDWQRLAALLR
jgi:hypothetical protein